MRETGRPVIRAQPCNAACLQSGLSLVRYRSESLVT